MGLIYDWSFYLRFWAKVDVGGDEECWLWTAHTDRDGYGRIRVRRDDGRWTHTPAPRAFLDSMYGPLGQLEAMHLCDNPACVNPRHLSIGTRRDNARDMVLKGRSLVGSRNGRSVLSASDVESVRARWPTENQAALAIEFGVTRSLISKIVRGTIWRGEPPSC